MRKTATETKRTQEARPHGIIDPPFRPCGRGLQLTSSPFAPLPPTSTDVGTLGVVLYTARSARRNLLISRVLDYNFDPP